MIILRIILVYHLSFLEIKVPVNNHQFRGAVLVGKREEKTLLYNVLYAEFHSPFLAVKHHFLGFGEIKPASTQESIEEMATK